MDNPYEKFTAGIKNFYKHYCEDKHTSEWCCEAQGNAFKSLIDEMAERPQDYVRQRGRVTTNCVEGFHGLALMYRDKRTDLGHTHYVCKTNMSICHKVITDFVKNNHAHTSKIHFIRILGPSGKYFVS